jgi:hypothetical protein
MADSLVAIVPSWRYNPRTLREKLTSVTGVDRLWYWAMRLLPIKCYK